MKIAIIGSRNLTVKNLEKYLPKDVTEIVSSGAKGVDTSAKEYALKNKLLSRHTRRTAVIFKYFYNLF